MLTLAGYLYIFCRCSINKEVVSDLYTVQTQEQGSAQTVMQALLNTKVFATDREHSVTCNYVLCKGQCAPVS